MTPSTHTCLLCSGAAASASHIKMEGSFNSSLQENQRQESSSEDKLSLLVQAAADANPSSLSETQDGYIPITDEQATQCGEKRELLDSGKVEETQEVSKSVVDSLELIVSSSNHFTDATKAAQVDNTLALDTVQLEKYFYLLNLKRLIGFLPL